jgi:hypothetical protein
VIAEQFGFDISDNDAEMNPMTRRGAVSPQCDVGNETVRYVAL